jgi:hypothetical protein
MVKLFLDPLQMSGSLPGHDVLDEAKKWPALQGQDNPDRYAANLGKLAQPYTLYADGEIIRVPYPPKGIDVSFVALFN